MLRPPGKVSLSACGLMFVAPLTRANAHPTLWSSKSGVILCERRFEMILLQPV